MNGISEYGDIIRAPEYQVVLIIDYDDGRMFPLTEDCPKCLLPVGNRKLLSYQLDMLAKSGSAGTNCNMGNCSLFVVLTFYFFKKRFTLLLQESMRLKFPVS